MIVWATDEEYALGLVNAVLTRWGGHGVTRARLVVNYKHGSDVYWLEEDEQLRAMADPLSGQQMSLRDLFNRVWDKLNEAHKQCLRLLLQCPR